MTESPETAKLRWNMTLENAMTYVCFDKDIVCGDRPEGWCLGCPKRGLMQVAVAPHAAAGAYPTAMRPATPEEHRWLQAGIRRSSTLIPHPDTARLDWLMLHMSGAEMRRLHIMTSAGCTRADIDRAAAALAPQGVPNA